MRKLIAAATATLLMAGCHHAAAPTAKSPLRAGTAQASKIGAPAKAADAFLRITYVTANGLMGSSFNAPPNHRVRLKAYTSADWNAQLDWTWRAWGPIWGFNDSAEWTTPMTDGTYTVDIQVRDRQNGWDWKTLYFRVQKEGTLEATDLSEADKAKAQGPASKAK